MSYSIIWSPKSKEDLSKLSPEIARRVILKLKDIELAPHHFIDKLTDVNCWKLRVGDYRVLLDINEHKKEIQILTIGHRRNVYK